MQLRTRVRPGVYWDESNTERPCGILELITSDGEVRRLAVVDADTGRRILDPIEAIPVASHEGGRVD